MSESSVQKRFAVSAAFVLPAWLIVAIFGDEVFAMLVWDNADIAFGFSLGEPWWWKFQFGVAFFFTVLALAITRIRSTGDHSAER